MASAYEKVQELGQDIYTQAQYATKVIRETNKQEIQDAVFSQNPLKKAGLHLWEGVKRFGSALKSGFNTASSFAKSAYGFALAGFNLGKYAKHKYEKAQKLNVREDALNKAAKYRKALEQDKADLQEGLARVALIEAEAKDQLAAKDSKEFWENSTWAGGRAVETAVDGAYAVGNAMKSGAYVASSAWHVGNSVVTNANEAFNSALTRVNDYFAAQAVDAAANAVLRAELPQFMNERAANADSLKQSGKTMPMPLVEALVSEVKLNKATAG